MGSLSQHFDRLEFACPDDCGFGLSDGDVDPKLIVFLEDLRHRAGDRAVYVSMRPGIHRRLAAGCRCHHRNTTAGGVRNSQHLRGSAADIVIENVTPDEVADLAEEMLPDGGVGRYDTFTHVDVRGHKARWDNRR